VLLQAVNFRKWTLFFSGLVIMSFGIALTIWAKILGVSPWDSFHLGLTNYLPLNYGQVSQVVGAVAILIGMLLGVKPKWGTVLNMVIVGWLINLFLDILPQGVVTAFRSQTFAVFLAGVILSGIGTGLYIAADAGIGPRDSIMVGINQKLGIKIGLARTFLEAAVVVLGFSLKGPVGIGTVFYPFTIGFFVDRTLFAVKKYRESKQLPENL
jgi:uncharacterized membrane protein YczE